MAQDILIGPVEGLPVEISLEFIVENIMDPIGQEEYQKVANNVVTQRRNGRMLIVTKPHIDELEVEGYFLLLKIRIKELGKNITCERVEKGFDNGPGEGGVPKDPKLGPRPTGPVLFERNLPPRKPGESGWKIEVTATPGTSTWQEEEIFRKDQERGARKWR